MAKELPYFRWFPKDAESDSKYSAMSLAELGLYHRCINHAWLNDGLPKEDIEIARALRIPLREFLKHWDRVSTCFNGELRLRNDRQEQERGHAVEKSRKATDAIRARYGRSTDVCTDEAQNGYGRSTDVPTDVLPRAFGSGSVNTTNTKRTSRKKETLPTPEQESDDWFESVFWEKWPVKEDKAGAKKAARKIKPHEREVVLAAIDLQRDRILNQDRPIHASTWINHRRWEDEPLAPLFSAAAAANGQRTYESATDRAIRIGHERVAKTGHL